MKLGQRIDIPVYVYTCRAGCATLASNITALHYDARSDSMLNVAGDRREVSCVARHCRGYGARDTYSRTFARIRLSLRSQLYLSLGVATKSSYVKVNAKHAKHLRSKTYDKNDGYAELHKFDSQPFRVSVSILTCLRQEIS